MADAELRGSTRAAPSSVLGFAAEPTAHTRIRSAGASLSLPFTPPLTHNLCFLLGVVVLSTRHLHLHERTNNSPSIFGKVPGPQDLSREQERLGKRQEQKGKNVFASQDIFFPNKSPWLC